MIEETSLSELSKVEKKTNFIGDTFVFHTKSGRWVCKDVTEDVDLRRWVLQKARRSVTASGVRKHPKPRHLLRRKQSTGRSEWSETSSSFSPSAVATDDFFAKTESNLTI